ncbi:ABC transporter ATP-binding protein [Enterococcus durans]|uniref:ABC transporter ATP-binding protein n=2 Tax=Enterococcus durans TaxID=53345 RepID=A0AB36S9S7_9ENTE|nr:ABC transporter ATP-binding protein [Enterococcus durans]EOT29571.1 ABC transporter ATP-binding protein/permease [Enterococcus durans ATCC 6056]EOU22693.1 ABC transporter ATP-binding protein/permease [Enterococcus durans ATCC 6056]PEH45578.1 ABC transporter ATP-binding protein [Enterococcus durans]QPQ26757.1 ABC transporter ATP-binding protein [Enterococcus durans]QXB38545.1 ABC transporter ATP-binding protein/permease [Enterococcus durans]
MKTKKISWKILRRFVPYLTAYSKDIWLAILLGIINGIATVVMTLQIGQSIDQIIGVGQVRFTKLFHLLLLSGGIVLINVVSQWLIQVLSNRLAYLSVAKLRKDAFARLNKLPLRYYDQNSHGNIVSRFTNDMDNISIAISAAFNQLFAGVAIIVLSFIFMLRLSPLLTLVVVCSTPIIFLVSWIVARASQNDFDNQQKIIGNISGFVTERIGNQKIIKAFQQEEVNQQQFRVLNADLYEKGQRAQFSSSLTNPSSRFIDHMAYLSIGLVGGLLALRSGSAITVGVISSFTIYSSQFSKPFIELSGITTQIQTAFSGLERAFELIDQPEETPDDPDAYALNPDTIKGEVVFNHVSFSYEPKQRLIENFNFKAEPGQTIAIVGKTGAGKSTLVNLLMRFYETTSGYITIDDYDIRHIQRDTLRKSFGMVLQDTWLFDSTLRENLQYGKPDASDEEINQALKASYMYEFVERLPEKLDTKIGGQGLKISDGQRQLLTIARTMISNPPMLILDEATSSVDTLTEKKIQNAFLAMMQGKTSFVIAHRLSTIKNADQILVMDQGAIVEMGTHDELLQKNGYYHQLYQAQFTKQ